MGEELSSPTPQNIVALATGFRHVIRGSKGMSTSWSPAKLGPLDRIVRDDAGRWRPDGLTATRIILRRVLDAYRTAPSDSQSRSDVAYTAKTIARSWGVTHFPTDELAGNALVDRGDLSAPIDESDEDDEAIDDVIPTGVLLGYSDRSRWQKAVTRHSRALTAASAGLDLDWATVDTDWVRTDTVGHPRWDTDARKITSWPPDTLPGGEGDWLISRLGDALGDDPRVITPDENRGARIDQLTQVLRRLAVDRHAAYLGTRLDTQRHFFHLRHAMARTWFTNDLLDLGGAEEFGVAIDNGSVARQTMLRSQASIARMEFYAVVHEWDAEAAEEVLARRSSAKRVFLGLERMPDALEQFQERLLSTPLHVAKTRDDSLREENADPTLPVYVSKANPRAREVFTMALHVRDQPTRKIIQQYVDMRKSPSLRFTAMLPPSRRTVLLADQSVSLDCVNIRDAKLQAEVAKLLKQSSVAGLEYAEFDRRDRAVLATKEGTREGLARTLDHGIRGIASLYRTRSASSDDFSDVRVDERSSLETEHQMSLALAGGAVRVVEALMGADANTQHRKRSDVVSDEISGALHWSARTVQVLERLEAKGYLSKARYDDGYLSSLAWRVPTRIMRHRVLCAVFAVAAAYDIRSDALPTVLDLDIAYDQMVSTQEIVDGHVAQVMQGVLFHSFLTGGMLSLPHRVAPALQDYDFITADVDAGTPRSHSVHLDGRNRMLATLANFDRDWDYGAVGTVQVGTRIARTLDERSHQEFSHWRTYIDVLGLLRSGAGDQRIVCLKCKWAGPLGKVCGAFCPSCGSTMIRVRPGAAT